MSGIQADAFERVVQQFFEAAAVPEFWPEALHGLSKACGAEGAAAHAADGLKTFGAVFSKGTASLYHDFVTRWRAPELNSHRSRGLALIARGWRGVLTEQDCFTPEELARDPFHQEFIVPTGFSSFAGLILAKGPGLMMSASIYRRPAQGLYQRSEIALINRLATHLTAASEVAMRIGMSSTRRMADAFTAAGHPVALIGRDGRVIHLSASFERLIGHGIHVKGGRLGSWQPEADRAITAAIGRASNYEGLLREPIASVVLPQRKGLRPLMAQIIPVVGVAHDILHLVSAIMILTDLDAASSGPAEALLQQAFGLTLAESRLAAQIATGGTLPEISASEGVARETLRSRLKSIFDKTSTSRQTELALLLSKVAKPPP